MGNILGEIIAHKRKEVSERQELYPVKLLEKSLFFGSTPVSLRDYLLRPDKVGIIAEIKRRSPSKGDLNRHICVETLSLATCRPEPRAYPCSPTSDSLGNLE